MSTPNEQINQVRDKFGSHWTDYLLWALGTMVLFIVVAVFVDYYTTGSIAILISAVASALATRLILAVICR